MARRRIITALIVLLLTALLIATALFNNREQETATDQVAKTYGNNLDHVVIIMEENKSFESLVNNPKATYINSMMSAGAVANNYYATAKNPYLALTSGTATKLSNTCSPLLSKCQMNANDITNEIEKSGRTWKMYAEGMTKPCSFVNTKRYAVRHNPFMYYSNITKSTSCIEHVVPYQELFTDLSIGKLPNYVFISPNLCNDMHDCPVSIGDEWLSENIPRILSSDQFKFTNSLLILTWDEGSRTNSHVLTIFVGPAAKINYVSNDKYNIYSLLRTIEYVWHIRPLTKNDKKAAVMDDMLR